MDRRTQFFFMHDLFRSIYDQKRIAVHLNSTDNVLNTDLSFEINNFQISKDKQQITLFGEEDIQVTITPQNLMSAASENEYYYFDTDMINMAVTFV